MFKFVLFVLLACSASSLVAAKSSGYASSKNSSIASRIVNGSPAVQAQFPHQAHLELVRSNHIRIFCGGSLISSKWIITSASCLVDIERVFISLGHIYYITPVLRMESTVFAIHENFDSGRLINNIGLIDLGQHIPESASIRPIRLPSRSQALESFTGKCSTASGWGYIENNVRTSMLYFVDLMVISNKRCIEDYNPNNIVETTICAAGIQSSSQGVCIGDYGSPLIITESDGLDTQIGVVNYYDYLSGQGCEGDKASVFERTSSYIDWIAKKTGIPVRA